MLSDGRKDNILFIVIPNKRGSIGFSVQMVGVTGITEYSSGVKGSDFSWDNSVYYFSYSKKLTDNFQYGLNLKYFSSKLKDSKATGFGFDFGAKTYFSKKITFGFVIKDIVSSIKWDTDTTDEIPLFIKTGITIKLFDYKLLVNTDLGKVEGEKDYRYSVGSEYWATKGFAFRVGMSEKGISAGMTINFKKFDIEYAFSDEDISSKQLLTISLKF